MKTWLEGNIIEIYSMYEENLLMFMGIRTQSTNMTAISKNVLTEHLSNIVNKYTNAYQRIIKMKPDDFLLT